MTDERFVGRVFMMSAVVFAFVVSGLLAYKVGAPFIWGTVVGYFVSVFSLMALSWVINRAFSPGGKGSAAKYGAVAIGKYAIIGAIIYLVVQTDAVSEIGFAAGFGIVYAVIALKAVGGVVSQSLSGKERPAGGE